MRLFYLTSKKYPSSTADHFFVKNMARAFTYILGQNFTLVVRQTSDELKDINVRKIWAPDRLKSVFYFFRLPFFILASGSGKDNFFFSNDAYLLTILIFWRKVFRFEYGICSDWHQLFADWRDTFVAKHSDLLITTSERLKELVVRKSGVKEHKILVAYGGVDLDKFAPSSNPQDFREGLSLPPDLTLVGYVGFYKTMGMEKGVATMIKALQFITNPEVRMVFVGGKPKEIEEYKAFADKEGVGERCIFVGVVSSGLIPKYEQAMNMLVIPYPDQPHFRDWGFPMKVYEYMASGRPIIYSNLQIMSEVLKNCATSFEPDDVKDLARKIESLNDLSGKAVVLAKNFTWHKRAEAIINFLR